MTGYIGKTTNEFHDVVGTQAQGERESQWGPMPGEVVSYDAATQTATIQPLYKPTHDGETVTMPQLYEVPIEFARSGNTAITHPVPVGTKVMLNPSMRSTENYQENEDGAPSDTRSYNLSDMRATLIGGDSLSKPLANVDPDNTHIRFNEDGSFGVRGSPEGKFKIEGSEGNLYDIIATFMELVASDELMINYGSSAGTGHRLFNRPELMELAAKVRAMAL